MFMEHEETLICPSCLKIYERKYLPDLSFISAAVSMAFYFSKQSTRFKYSYERFRNSTCFNYPFTPYLVATANNKLENETRRPVLTISVSVSSAFR